MILETLLLADNALAAEGKLYVHGGGITRITPPELPWSHPMLTLVLRLRADDVEELVSAHQLAIAIVDPEGGSVVPRAEVGLLPDKPPDLLEGEPLYVTLALTVAPVRFSTDGLHRVQVDLDGERVANMPLPVRVVPQGR